MKLQFPRASLLLVLSLGILSLARGATLADPPAPGEPPAPAAPAAPPAPAAPTAPAAAAPAQPGKPAAPQPLPTMQDLHDMYQAGQYAICLQQIARVSRLTGQDARPYDKSTLQLLRGDCLLHQNDRASAIAAYQIAAKSPDPKISVPARANELVARASDKMTYKPKAANAGGPIDIVNDVSRRKAMMTMFDDQLAEADTVLKHAKSAQDLMPIIAAVPKVLDLYALELTGTGKDEQMRPEMTAIGQRARTLIDRELQTINDRIYAVEKRADQVTDAGYGRPGGQWWWNGGVVRRGLHSDDRQDLRDTLDYLERIHQSAERGVQIARQVDGNVEAWEGVIEKVSHTSAHAQNVLDAE